MLRALVLALLLANLGWFAWTRGWLPAGWLPPPGDAAQREPQRLARQLRPDAITVGPPGSVSVAEPAVEPPAPGPTCVQAGPLRSEDWPGVTSALARAGIPADAWQRLPAAAALAGGAPPTGENDGDWLRLPAADAALLQRLPALAWPGLVFLPCP